jgi:predicted neuraminidase
MKLKLFILTWVFGIAVSTPLRVWAAEPGLAAEQIFPPVEPQTHAPGIVECPNGDLLASWYGDLELNDGAIVGARKRKGESTWDKPFLLADRLGFPDGNTCMMVDARGKLWLFWPTVIGGSWESCLMNYKVSTDYDKPGAPKWDRHEVMLLKPADFKALVLERLGGRKLRAPRGAIGGRKVPQEPKLDDPLYQRLGWATRCKPTVLPTGRILLPLYTDTFSISIMAVSDDAGANWYASGPLVGPGNIQPTVLRRNDGSLVAYMRDSFDTGRIQVCESRDDGLTWGKVVSSDLPNPGAGIDAVRLANGHWALVYNDSSRSRAQLAVSISDDEGRTWPHIRHLEIHKEGRYHYPAVIQGRDGTIHAIYSTFIAPADSGANKPGPGGKPAGVTLKGIKHAAFDEAWVRAGD